MFGYKQAFSGQRTIIPILHKVLLSRGRIRVFAVLFASHTVKYTQVSRIDLFRTNLLLMIHDVKLPSGPRRPAQNQKSRRSRLHN